MCYLLIGIGVGMLISSKCTSQNFHFIDNVITSIVFIEKLQLRCAILMAFLKVKTAQDAK